MKAFILGASGQIGYAIARHLLEAGWHVTCGQRGEALPELRALGATSVRVDRDTVGAIGKAIGDGTDAFIDAIAFEPAHAEQLLTIQNVVGQFVVVSSASVYRDDRGRTIDEATTIEELPQMPIPIHERQPTVAPGLQTYSTKKIAIETAMLDGSNAPVSIIRPCAVYGVYSKHPREWWFVKRWLDKRSQIPLCLPQSVFQTSAADNVAEVISTALGRRFRGVLNVGDPDAPSVERISEIIAKSLDWTCEFIDVGTETDEVGSTPWSSAHPFVLDMESAARLGYRPRTSYAAYSYRMCHWLIEAARDKDWREVFPVLKLYPELFDYAAEDAFFLRRANAREAGR